MLPTPTKLTASDGASAGVWLLQKFLDLQAVRPTLSKRGFAKRLEMSPSHLANLLSGKRALTAAGASVIADRLSLSPNEREELLALTTKSKHEQKRSGKGPLLELLPRVHSKILEEDQFKFMADWYHLGILALAGVKDPKADPQWIADRIGITSQEATIGLARLKKLDLIKIIGNAMKVTNHYVETTNDVPSQAIRSHHRQILGRAERSIDGVDMNRRHLESSTIAISSKDISKVNQAVSDFHDQMKSLALKRDDKDEVYTLSVQFFPSNLR